MHITVNGELNDVAPQTSVAELLKSLELNPRGLAVERNRELVPRANHERCLLQEGDCLEIVTLVGGG